MITDSTIQMLVDGELESADRAELVQKLEQDSDGWRRIATAFMHQQLIDTAARELVSGEDNVDLRDHEGKSRVPKVEKDPASANSPAGVASRFKWHSIVAIAICALLLGFWVGSFRVDEQGTGLANGMSSQSATDESASDIDGILALEDALARSVTPIPHSFRRELLKAGYWLDEGLHVAEVNLPNGGRMEMPIKRYNIHYLGGAAFQ